ncbi:DUF2179 domain-containing protein [Anaeromonas frigoriresistens]|uniref:DUF2179 domain-containing protein n=1 Tax=Anaeromonas frigoriresistens TaxID=2683708 RepID=UPI003314CCA7
MDTKTSDNNYRLFKRTFCFFDRKVKRGVTFLEGEGDYTRTQQKVINCMGSTIQLFVVKNLFPVINPNIFMTVMDTLEIRGSGFNKPVF